MSWYADNISLVVVKALPQPTPPGSPSPSYPRLGEPLPVELANTCYAVRGEPRDGLSSSGELAAWLRLNVGDRAARGVDPAGALPAFRGLRDAMRGLFEAALAGAPAPPAALRLVNLAAAGNRRVIALEWPGSGAPRAVARADGADPAAAVLAEIAEAAIELLGGEGRGSLRSCQGPRCVLFFVRGRRRRAWCSNACGNRARVARHYARHRSPARGDRHG